MQPIVTILTDFGDQDPYVGIMKGVIAGIAPEAIQIDLTHKIPPGDIEAAAYALVQAVPVFPPGTIHLVVVDPGVGSHRRPIAATAGPARLVGPDNGVFTFLYQIYGVQSVVELAAPQYMLARVSNTFHGRDIFSPAAAHLAHGVDLAAFGPPVSDPARIPLPRLAPGGEGHIAGQVLRADHFGNVVSSIGWLNWLADDMLELDPWLPGEVETRQFSAAQARVTVTSAQDSRRHVFQGIWHTFSDVARGEAAVVVGSERHLGFVVNRGSAAEQLGLRPGDDVLLETESAA